MVRVGHQERKHRCCPASCEWAVWHTHTQLSVPRQVRCDLHSTMTKDDAHACTCLPPSDIIQRLMTVSRVPLTFSSDNPSISSSLKAKWLSDATVYHSLFLSTITTHHNGLLSLDGIGMMALLSSAAYTSIIDAFGGWKRWESATRKSESDHRR